jgi:multiple sugar transport system substrate-binding protein
MRSRAIALAATLLLAPLAVHAADLVVWWEKGFYPQADEAVAEIVAAFEQDTGKEVELVQPTQAEIIKQAVDALRAGRAPAFLFSTDSSRFARWAYEDQLMDLARDIAPVLELFDADTVEVSTMLNGNAGQRRLYALPMGRMSNHVHVWNSLLERAGLTLADIPKTWEDFWSFWCDRVQPAVRKALGRNDIWGVGLPMSASATDTDDQFFQFQLAYGVSWIGLDRRPRVDDPVVRAGLVKALDAYTTIWRKGCTPPESASWANIDNNKAFLAQIVVMTPNGSLSIPAALKRERPEDYYRNAATLGWPAAANGQPLVVMGYLYRGVVFKDGGHGAAAEEFVRFLAEGGWLAHWLTFMGDQFMPPMRKLVDQPFWLDPSDPHRMRAAIQIMTEPHLMNMEVRGNEWRSERIWEENVWSNAVHRVAGEGISPAQAVDEAIARIKEILAE